MNSAPDVFKDRDLGAGDAGPFAAGTALAKPVNPGKVGWVGHNAARLAHAILSASGGLHAEFWSEKAALRYGLALLLVAAATALSFFLQIFTDRALAFPFYAAVVISTWFGIGPGLVSIVCSALVVDFFWIPPLYTLGIDDENWTWYVVFSGSALISLGWTWQRRRVERLLEFTVAQRTAELVQANTALTKEIAERRAAEAELQEAQAEVARTLRLATVAETAAAIAHEINQPLAALSANAGACQRSLARDPPLLDLAAEAAGCIADDATRAAEVIARVRALLNKEGPKHVPVDINRLIEDVVMLSRSVTERQAITVRTEPAPSLPSFSGDPVQLQQVLLNLVTNGIEAMAAPIDRPRILTIRSGLDEAGAIIVEVEDTGRGVDAKQAERVFDSFYTTKADGIGVGLSISRSIIEAHGGRLWLESTATGGARFCFALPVVAITG